MSETATAAPERRIIKRQRHSGDLEKVTVWVKPELRKRIKEIAGEKSVSESSYLSTLLVEAVSDAPSDGIAQAGA